MAMVPFSIRSTGRVLASAMVAALLTGCTITVGGAPSPSASDPSAPVQTSDGRTPSGPASGSPAPSETAPTAASPANRIWTHTLVTSATRPAAATSTRIKGADQIYPNSTSLWVGCEGVPDEVVLAVNGRYKRLFGHLGLRDGVPAGLVVHTLVLVDGNPVQNIQLDSDDANAVEVNLVLTGAKQVTFQSQAVKGECSPSDESYVVLGDGYVE